MHTRELELVVDDAGELDGSRAAPTMSSVTTQRPGRARGVDVANRRSSVEALGHTHARRGNR